MVMPRSRSRSMESRNCSLISRWVRAPVRSISRSERVVLPWSMWAMIEKLRMFFMWAIHQSINAFARARTACSGACMIVDTWSPPRA